MALKGFEKKDPAAGLNQLLQLVNQIGQVADRNKSQINTSLNSLLKLSNYAINESSMNNIVNEYNKLSSDASTFQETNVQYNLIGDVLKNKQSQINQYTKAVNDFEKEFQSVDFLDKESEFVDLNSKILAMKDEKGNQKYESVMEWVGNEYARVESMYNTIKSGQELGLKRGDGLDDANILMEVEKYSNRLNGALEAFISGGDITAEEARLIITGDRNTFERVKKLRTSKEGMIETGIKEYDTLISLLDKKSDDVSWMQVFQQSGVSDKQIGEINQIASENNLYGMDSSQLKAARQRYIVERDKLIDSYKYWTGHSYIGTSNVGAEEFGEFADVGIVDKDGDGTPDYIQAPKDQEMETSVRSDMTAEQIEEERIKLEPLNVAYPKKLHPEVSNELKTIFPKGDYKGKEGEFFHSESGKYRYEILEEGIRASNIRKERELILDGVDKASTSMNQFLKGDLDLDQAHNQGKWSESERGFKGSYGRKKLKAFKEKFKNQNLPIDEFINKNKKEYYEMTKILKYGNFYFKDMEKCFAMPGTPFKFPGRPRDHYQYLYEDYNYSPKKSSDYYVFEDEKPNTKDKKEIEYIEKEFDWLGFEDMNIEQKRKLKKRAVAKGMTLKEYKEYMKELEKTIKREGGFDFFGFKTAARRAKIKEQY